MSKDPQPVFWIIAVLAAMSFIFAVAADADWQRVGSVSGGVWGNYSAFDQHSDGKVYFVVNDSYQDGSVYRGEVVLQVADRWPGRVSAPVTIIPESALAAYYDERGQAMTYARTNAVASDGVGCHALLHVGAPYGSPTYQYRPAYASSPNCRSWTYHGPVTVNGVEAPYIFSGSMAYVIFREEHYMLQAAGAYGLGRLIAFKSADGFHYETFGGEISVFPDDRPVFPDMAHCGGEFHVVYEDGWGNGSTAVRHLKSWDALNWELVDANIPPSTYKGINIGCVNGQLYGLTDRTLWLYSDGEVEPPSPPEPRLCVNKRGKQCKCPRGRGRPNCRPAGLAEEGVL